MANPEFMLDSIARAFIEYVSSTEGLKESEELIPEYHGSLQDGPIRIWLKEADQVVKTNELKPELKKNLVASRLREPTIVTWNENRLKNMPNETYEEWKKALLKQFDLPDDLRSLKLKLHNLKQQPGQDTKQFASEIEMAYKIIYEYSLEDAQKIPTQMRDDMLLMIFMQGIAPDIKKEMLSKGDVLLPENYTWDFAKEAAVNAEASVHQKWNFF